LYNYILNVEVWYQLYFVENYTCRWSNQEGSNCKRFFENNWSHLEYFSLIKISIQIKLSIWKLLLEGNSTKCYWKHDVKYYVVLFNILSIIIKNIFCKNSCTRFNFVMLQDLIKWIGSVNHVLTKKSAKKLNWSN